MVQQFCRTRGEAERCSHIHPGKTEHFQGFKEVLKRKKQSITECANIKIKSIEIEVKNKQYWEECIVENMIIMELKKNRFLMDLPCGHYFP